MWNTHQMDFANIEAFAAVVELAGFTRAAHALHLSQPALSRRIGLLEAELRKPLIERRRRGAILTDAGRLFLPYAQAALASLRDGVAAVQEVERGAAGSVAVAIVGTLASTGIAERLGHFRDAHPKVRVVVRTGSSAEVSSLVRRGEVAIGLRYFADPDPAIVSRRLYREAMVVVAAARHRLVAGRSLRPGALRGETWIAFPPKRRAAIDPFGQVLVRCLAGAGLDGAEMVAIDSLTAQKRLVEAGFGLALVPASSIEEELARGTLKVLKLPALAASVDVTLIHRKGAFLSQADRRLMQMLGDTQG